MADQLREYQIEDVEFLASKFAAGCFNEPRTGKTPTILKTIEAKDCKKVLVICPASAILQWKEEYERWLNKPVVALLGTAQKKEKLLSTWEHGLIIGYDSFKPTKKSLGFVDRIIDLHPDVVILDEAHRIKNPKSLTTQAILKTKLTPNRYALTGTPAPGKAEDIWPILHWLQPLIYPSYWKFINKYFETARKSGKGGQQFIEIGKFKPGMDRDLQIHLSHLATQRKRRDVMAWLPQKDITQVRLEPNKEQQKYLYELKKYFETGDIITKGVLDRLIRYRQICLHPDLIRLRGGSPKLDWILQYIQDYPTTPTIIFSKFTSFIRLLEAHITTPVGLITGDTTIPQRNEVKKAFQNGELNLLLINIDAGKEALTLDRAEAIIFSDKYPPIGDILQAEDRFVATTEDKASKPHRIYELMIKGTYDEELYRLLAKRLSETDIINDFKKHLERR